jgi:hypothetical protein
MFGLGHVQFDSLATSGEGILREAIAPFASSSFTGFLLGVTAVKSSQRYLKFCGDRLECC